MPSISTANRAQVWSFDFVLGVIIFVLIIAIYYSVSSDLNFRSTKEMQRLQSDAQTLSSLILTQGVPRSWSPDSFRLAGILSSEGKLNETKFYWARNFSANQLLAMYGQQNSFWVELRNSSDGVINISDSCGFGTVNFSMESGSCPGFARPGNVTNLIAVERLLLKGSTPIRMEVYEWS